MSARLVSGSSNVIAVQSGAIQYIPLPTTGYPFTVGMWFTTGLTDANARTLFSFSNTAATNQYLLVRKTATNTMQICARGGGSEVVTATSGALTANVWNYMIARFFSATARYLHLLNPIGIASISNVTSTPVTGLNFLAISSYTTSGGTLEVWDGKVAEYWLIGDDCFPGLTTTAVDALVHKLAYGGPFAYPLVASKLLDYRSFRLGPGAWGMEDQAQQGDYYRDIALGLSAGNGWNCLNSVPVGPADHPPLPTWYQRVNERARIAVI
jgi:hypothetical protein